METKQTRSLTFRIDVEVYKELCKTAKKQDRSVSNVLNRIVKAAQLSAAIDSTE